MKKPCVKLPWTGGIRTAAATLALVCAGLAGAGATASQPGILGVAARTPSPGSGGDAPAPVLPGELKLSHGPFGEVTIYQPAGQATSVTLFVSGDGGWNLGVVDMARHLIGMGAVVVGIDIRRYLKAVNAPSSACRSLAVDFEDLAHAVERQLRLPDYLPPVLVGYSSGATLVYATAVQSPKGTFAGALSLGFCPDLAITQKLCTGSGLAYATQYARVSGAVEGVVFSPAQANATPWTAFQGDIDEVCAPEQTRQFVSQTRNADLVWLPRVGHGFSVERNWLPQFKDAYARLAAGAITPPTQLADLPIVEVPATTSTADTDELFAVLLTGDGGWAGLDQDVSAALAAQGIPVAGLNTLKYFWQARTPESAAADLERIIRHYRAAWKRPQVLLIGYSLGAEVLPFLYTRLPDEIRAAVRSVNLLGPGTSASFAFHFSDWVPGSGSSDGRPVAPEIERMGGVPTLCLYGAEESDSPCRRLGGSHVRSLALAGGHHFGGDYPALVQQILVHARR